MKAKYSAVFLIFCIATSFLGSQVPENWVYDPDAEFVYTVVDYGPWLAEINRSAGIAIFRSADDGRRVVGSYNLRYQFWNQVNDPDLRQSVDINRLFRSLDLDLRLLDRDEPTEETWAQYSDLERNGRLRSSDPALAAFIGYLEANGVSKSHQQQYLDWAQNPAKRGALVAWDPGRPPVEASFQQDSLKPSAFAYQAANAVPEEQLRSVGGMEYYFALASGDYLMPGDAGFSIFTSNDRVPVSFVEVVNSARPRLRVEGAASIAREMAIALEQAYGKSMDLQLERVELDYSELRGPRGVALGAWMNQVFERVIDNEFGRDRLYIYYMADLEEFRRYDPSISHPYAHGATAGNWPENRHNFLHEFGHVLGLRHHFATNDVAGLAESHLSAPCVMNYNPRFTGDVACPICRYALGVPVAGTARMVDLESSVPSATDQAPQLIMARDYLELVLNGEQIAMATFKGIEFLWAQPSGSGYVAAYFDEMGHAFVGTFDGQLRYQSQASLGALDPIQAQTAVDGSDTLFIHYQNGEGDQYLGAFTRPDSQSGYQYLGETRFGQLEMIQWTVDTRGVVALYSDGSYSWIGRLGPDGNFLAQSSPQRGRVAQMLERNGYYYFNFGPARPPVMADF